MATEFVDLVLFPHCDMHVALTGTPQLRVTVNARTFDPAKPDRYGIVPVTHECTFEFFAPHNDVGQRIFPGLPKIDPPTGLVTATTPGVYLFQARWKTAYIVGRLQVHSQITAWWFGNDSVTTALDVGTAASPGIAHAQPSIYAKFSDDATGADRIGDITGHRYVTLTPDEPAKLAITQQGRLRGLVETTDPAQPTHITGSFLGKTAKLPVRVFDYAKSRADLYPIQTPDVAHADDMRNIVFVPEGFRDTSEDRKLFDEVVTKTKNEMFDKPRHEPYGMLEGSFNIFQAFIPSEEHFLTCGFRVEDQDLDKARPIPYNRDDDSQPGLYTLQDLVARVGLPMHKESRPFPLTIWNNQSLHDFEQSKVNAQLIAEWTNHYTTGILHARDTILGLYLGSRPADQLSGFSDPAVERPAKDEVSDKLKAFVRRVYEFYNFQNTRHLTPDPRRHPPELYSHVRQMTNISIMRYLGGLKYAYEPIYAIGRNWVPGTAKSDISLGLVVVIAYDDMHGGTNNDGLLVVQTMDRRRTLAVNYADLADKREMRRQDPLTQIEPDLTDIVETVTHEFGHTFNLGDEYEFKDGHGNSDTMTADLGYDNLSVLGFLRPANAPGSRLIDPAKVKWLHLPLMSMSAKLLAASVSQSGGIKVTIDPRYIGKWVQAKKDNAEVRLRNKPGPGGQLPLSSDPGQFLIGLHIGDIDESLGTIVLIDATPPFPQFEPGSVLYVPLVVGGQAIEVVDEKVQQWLVANRSPLNRDPDNVNARRENDKPRDIPGFFPPCDSTKTVGIFEGGNTFAGGFYRPAGRCRMRSGDRKPTFWTELAEDGGAFCDVCKWLIVNRVDPSYHAVLSAGIYFGTL